MKPEEIGMMLRKFEKAFQQRLAKGEVEYENKSFSEDPYYLFCELQEECADQAVWGFVSWCRLETMKQAIRKSKRNRVGHESGKVRGR